MVILYINVNTGFHSICSKKGNKSNQVSIAVGSFTKSLINSEYTFLLVILVISVTLLLRIKLNLGFAVYLHVTLFILDFQYFGIASSREYMLIMFVFHSDLALKFLAVANFFSLSKRSTIFRLIKSISNPNSFGWICYLFIVI